ncbi:MAG: hypothetical protein J6A21_08870, partial [Lentisphaeria bacterium]|nr:hypothetical protein [Lentisphaeria bacterium]
MAKRGTVSRIFFRYRFYLKGLKKYEADGILYVLAEEVAKMIDIHETKEWKEMVARVDRRVAAEGGSTGSNMAEPPYVPPGPVK